MVSHLYKMEPSGDSAVSVSHPPPPVPPPALYLPPPPPAATDTRLTSLTVPLLPPWEAGW